MGDCIIVKYAKKNLIRNGAAGIGSKLMNMKGLNGSNERKNYKT
jgi:hypothetical protein